MALMTGLATKQGLGTTQAFTAAYQGQAQYIVTQFIRSSVRHFTERRLLSAPLMYTLFLIPSAELKLPKENSIQRLKAPLPPIPQPTYTPAHLANHTSREPFPHLSSSLTTPQY